MKRIGFGRSWYARHASGLKRQRRCGSGKGMGVGEDNQLAVGAVVEVEPVVEVESVESCSTKVCLLNNTTNGDTTGGIFISENGLIATCYHLLTDTSDDVRVRLHSEQNWMEAKFVGGHELWDIAIFSTDSTRVFGYVKVPKTINLNWGDQVLTFTNSANSPFAISSGFVSYPFPDNVVLPEMSETNRDVVHADQMEIINGPVPWLEGRFLVGGPASCMLCTLPGIHVSNICSEPATSGCPLFVEKTMEFIGLGSHNYRAAMCYTPSTLIPKLLSEVGKGTSSVGEGSSNVPAF